MNLNYGALWACLAVVLSGQAVWAQNALTQGASAAAKAQTDANTQYDAKHDHYHDIRTKGAPSVHPLILAAQEASAKAHVEAKERVVVVAPAPAVGPAPVREVDVQVIKPEPGPGPLPPVAPPAAAPAPVREVDVQVIKPEPGPGPLPPVTPPAVAPAPVREVDTQVVKPEPGPGPLPPAPTPGFVVPMKEEAPVAPAPVPVAPAVPRKVWSSEGDVATGTPSTSASASVLRSEEGKTVFAPVSTRKEELVALPSVAPAAAVEPKVDPMVPAPKPASVTPEVKVEPVAPKPAPSAVDALRARNDPALIHQSSALALQAAKEAAAVGSSTSTLTRSQSAKWGDEARAKTSADAAVASSSDDASDTGPSAPTPVLAASAASAAAAAAMRNENEETANAHQPTALENLRNGVGIQRAEGGPNSASGGRGGSYAAQNVKAGVVAKPVTTPPAKSTKK